MADNSCVVGGVAGTVKNGCAVGVAGTVTHGCVVGLAKIGCRGCGGGLVQTDALHVDDIEANSSWLLNGDGILGPVE